MIFFDYLLFVAFGIVLGIATGLTPGIHINAVAALIIAIAPLLSNFAPLCLVATIVSMAIIHIFLQFVPSIYLGVPEEGTVLSILPGHKLLLEGRGAEAIRLTVIGCFGAILTSIALLAGLVYFISTLYSIIRPSIGWILLAIVFFMIGIEQTWKQRAWGLLVFALSGLLGYVVLNSNLVPPKHALFPLLAGLFGLSTLIISMKSCQFIPAQYDVTEIKFPKQRLVKCVMFGSIAGMVVGLLPGIGAAQATVLAQQVSGRNDHREFLVSVSGVDTSNFIFSLAAIYAIGHPRSGAAVAVEKILGGLNVYELLFMISIILLTSGIAVTIALKSSKWIAKRLERVNYRKLCLAISVFMLALIVALTGPFGFLIAFVSTCIGLIAPLVGIRRTHGMGVLLLPTIVYFLTLSS